MSNTSQALLEAVETIQWSGPRLKAFYAGVPALDAWAGNSAEVLHRHY